MTETYRKLKDWYEQNRRILPWREDPTPYHVWISEIMLQQTRVEAVRGYYARFLTALPDVSALAAAPEDVYLKLWEGLGYYSRVRNLHRAAVVVVEEYGGSIPSAEEELRRLPGIGRYTAAAIASIAFGKRAIALDGNLLRVFSRLAAYEGDIKEPAAGKAAEEYYLKILENEPSAGLLNQAFMDLGATVCLPNAAPRCDACPLAGICLAHAAGCETAYPHLPAKKARKLEERTVFLIRYGDAAILHKRPPKGLLAGLYEFPNADGKLTEEEALRYVAALGFEALRIRPLPPAKHIFTHKEWHMSAFEVRADEFKNPLREDMLLLSVSEIREKYSIPSAFAAYTALL